MKQPPFVITNRIIDLVSEISELVGKISVLSDSLRSPVLRRKNRIHTIHGSLSIENNSMTVEQITAVLDGKTVLAPPKDIAEVRNAFEIYENMELLDPFSVDDLLKAHGVMMRGLAEDAGSFRERNVGVADSRTGEIIHFGTLPQYVPGAVDDLLEWTRESDVHMLIKSCVFHYEFELIHPFSDGNGRTGRLWHTLMLSKWNPVFAWLPVESMVFRNQQEYYNAINRSNVAGSSEVFIEFMLDVMVRTLEEAIETSREQVGNKSGTSQEQVGTVTKEMLLEFCRIPRSREEMQQFCGISGIKQFRNKYLRPLLESGELMMTVPDKPNSRNQRYVRTPG